jgi:hypothetical protein
MQIWVAFCKPTANSWHWMLTLCAPGATFGFRIHSVGGPAHNKDYTTEIAWKRVQSFGVDNVELLGVTQTKNFNKAVAAAKRTPPQQCQNFVVAVVALFEKKGWVLAGTADYLSSRVRLSERARLYADAHPVPSQVPTALRRRSPLRRGRPRSARRARTPESRRRRKLAVRANSAPPDPSA